MTDELIERVARAMSPEWFAEDAWRLANYPGQVEHYQENARRKAKAALAALKVGDDLPNGLHIETSQFWHGVSDENNAITARQAAEEMRERCENLCRRRAEEYLRQAQPLSGLPSGQHALDLMGEANQCAVAIRALPLEPGE